MKEAPKPRAPSPRPVATPACVDLADEAGMAHWLAHFGVTRQQLEEAVQAVGGEPARVHEHLLNQGASAGAG